MVVSRNLILDEKETDDAVTDAVNDLDYKHLESEMGITKLTGIKGMSSDERNAFYDNLVTIDPDGSKIFSRRTDHGQYILDVDVYFIKATAKIKLVDLLEPIDFEFLGFIKKLDDKSYSYYCAIYPNFKIASDIFGCDIYEKMLNITKNSALRFVLFKYGDRVSNLSIACQLNVGDVFSFIPGADGAARNETLRKTTLGFTSLVSFQSTFEPMTLNFPTHLIGTLSFGGSDGGLKISDALTLDHITLHLSVIKVLQCDDGTLKRRFEASFTACARIQISNENSSQLRVTGNNVGGGLELSATMENWKDPFDLSGLTIDYATLRIRLRPNLSIRLCTIFNINYSMTFSLDGEWTKGQGFALFGEFEAEKGEEITLNTLSLIHEKITHPHKRLEVASSDYIPWFELERIAISFCSRDHDHEFTNVERKSITRKSGFEISGDCKIGDCDASLDVVVSRDNGLLFNGKINNVKIGNYVTIDEAKIEFEINPKDKSKNMFAATAQFEIKEIGKTVNVAIIFKKNEKCLVAEIDEKENFKVSQMNDKVIADSLSFLNFRFSNLRFSASTADEHRITIENWKNGTNLDIPPGKILQGSAHFKLINTLIDLNFVWDISQKIFSLDEYIDKITIDSKLLTFENVIAMLQLSYNSNSNSQSNQLKLFGYCTLFGTKMRGECSVTKAQIKGEIIAPDIKIGTILETINAPSILINILSVGGVKMFDCKFVKPRSNNLNDNTQFKFSCRPYLDEEHCIAKVLSWFRIDVDSLPLKLNGEKTNSTNNKFVLSLKMHRESDIGFRLAFLTIDKAKWNFEVILPPRNAIKLGVSLHGTLEVFETKFKYTGRAVATFEMNQLGMPKLTFQVSISADDPGCKGFNPLSRVGFDNCKIFVFKEIVCGIEISPGIPVVRLQCDMTWLGIDIEAFVDFTCTLCMQPVPVSFYFEMQKLSIHQIIESFGIISYTNIIRQKIPNFRMTDVMVAISLKDNVEAKCERLQKAIRISRGLVFHGKLNLFDLFEVENHFKLNTSGIYFKSHVDIYQFKKLLENLKRKISDFLKNKKKEAKTEWNAVSKAANKSKWTVGWILDLVRASVNAALIIGEAVAWTVFSVYEKAITWIRKTFFTFDRVMFELLLQRPDQFKVAFEIVLTMFNKKIPLAFSIGSSNMPQFNNLQQHDINEEIMLSEMFKHCERRWNDYQNGVKSHAKTHVKTVVNKCRSYVQEEKVFKQQHGEDAPFESKSEEYQWIENNINNSIEDYIDDYKLEQEYDGSLNPLLLANIAEAVMKENPKNIGKMKKLKQKIEDVIDKWEPIGKDLNSKKINDDIRDLKKVKDKLENAIEAEEKKFPDLVSVYHVVLFCLAFFLFLLNLIQLIYLLFFPPSTLL